MEDLYEPSTHIAMISLTFSGSKQTEKSYGFEFGTEL